MPRIKLTSRLKDKQELKWDFVCVYCCFGKLSLVAIVRFHVCRLCCGRTIKTVKSDVEDCLPSNLMCLTWDPRRSGLEKKKTCVASVASPVYSRGFLILWAKPEKRGLSCRDSYFSGIWRPWIANKLRLVVGAMFSQLTVSHRATNS